MNFMGSLKNILILFLILLLFGCNPIKSFHFQSKSNIEHKLIIQTVEFSSTNVVTNVGVTLIDKDTDKTIAKETVNDEGIVVFSGVKQNKAYKIVIHEILPSGEWHERMKKEIIYDDNKSNMTIETFHSNKNSSLSVPVVLQNPELPNGCEVTALTAVLNYYGLNVDKVELAKNYLPTQQVIKKGTINYGPDPNNSYAGDPFKKTGGYYVFPIPIVEAANEVLIENNSELRAIDIPKMTKNDFIDFIQSGVPVIAWTTLDLKKPHTKGFWVIEETKEKHSIYLNLHVVVVTGYQNGKVFIMNPLKGNEVIDEEKFFNSFQSIGSKAVVIL